MNIIPEGNVAPSVKRIGPPRLMSVTEATHVHEPSAFLRNESMKVCRPPPPGALYCASPRDSSRRNPGFLTLYVPPRGSAEEVFARQGGFWSL
jgi:hypothetical protein